MYRDLVFNLGRDAIRYLVQYYEIKKIHIPYYLCDVIRHTLVEENCKPLFYHIDDNFYPAKDFPKDDFILYPNYWGTNGKNVKKLAYIYPKLIVDNAHAYYDKPSGFACFNTGHKFGYKSSVLWIKDNNKNDYLTQIDNQAEERKTEFLKIHNKYKDTNLLKPDLNSIPFCYPFLAETTKDADKLVKILKEEGKTIYRFWNPLPKSFNEYKFYSRLVPIPVLPH